jgi:hypothetical protein
VVTVEPAQPNPQEFADRQPIADPVRPKGRDQWLCPGGWMPRHTPVFGDIHTSSGSSGLFWAGRRRVMTGLRRGKWVWGAFAAAAPLVVGGVLFAGAPAQAASFCYEGSTITSSKSLSYSDVVIHESLTYKPLYTCSGTKIGVHVTGASASYTGGSASSTHGIDQIGVLMEKVGGSACDPVGPALNTVSPATRSVSATANFFIYTGTYKDCFDSSYSYSQTCTFAHLNQAFHIVNTLHSAEFRWCLNATAIDPFVEI